MKSSQAKIKTAIIAIFFVMPGALIVNPAIQNIAEAYPTIPYTLVLLVSTIPLLIVVPISLISGAIAGEKLKYKYLLIISMILYIVGGTMPFFFTNFYLMLASRVIYGIGVGGITPLGNSLVMRFFEGQKRANMLGVGSVVVNISSTLFMLLSGIVSSIDVKYIWLIHLIAIIPLVLMMYLPEPEKILPTEQSKLQLPMSIFVIIGVVILVYMNLNTMLLNMSSIITLEKIGNAAVAGTILSMYAVGGIIGGVIFGQFYRLAKKMTIPIAVLVIAIGLSVVNFSTIISMMIVGSTIVGIGFFTMIPAVLMETGESVSIRASAMVSAMILASINLGGFLSSFYIGTLSTITGNFSPRLPLYVAMIVMVVVSLVWTVFVLTKKVSYNT